MRLRIIRLALGVCLLFGSAVAQQQPAIGTWQGSLGDMGCVGIRCCGLMGPCRRSMSVFTPNASIVITRIELLAIPHSNKAQTGKGHCSTAAVKVHDFNNEKTYAQYHLLPYIEDDTGAIYVDSGSLAVQIGAGTTLRMTFSYDGSEKSDCQMEDVKVTVQYQTLE